MEESKQNITVDSLRKLIDEVYYGNEVKEFTNEQQKKYMETMAFVDKYKNNLQDLPDGTYDFGSYMTGKGGAIMTYNTWKKIKEEWKSQI